MTTVKHNVLHQYKQRQFQVVLLIYCQTLWPSLQIRLPLEKLTRYLIFQTLPTPSPSAVAVEFGWCASKQPEDKMQLQLPRGEKELQYNQQMCVGVQCLTRLDLLPGHFLELP